MNWRENTTTYIFILFLITKKFSDFWLKTVKFVEWRGHTQSINWNYLGDDNDEEIVRLAFRTLDRLDFGLIKLVRRFECKDDNEGKWILIQLRV